MLPYSNVGRIHHVRTKFWLISRPNDLNPKRSLDVQGVEKVQKVKMFSKKKKAAIFCSKVNTFSRLNTIFLIENLGVGGFKNKS